VLFSFCRTNFTRSFGVGFFICFQSIWLDDLIFWRIWFCCWRRAIVAAYVTTFPFPVPVIVLYVSPKTTWVLLTSLHRVQKQEKYL
jgi:hypothetical protein